MSQPTESASQAANPLPLTEDITNASGRSPQDTSFNGDNEEVTGNAKPVINELLCFISNKIKVMPYDMLVKLGMDFYSDECVEQAKDTLFDTAFGACDSDSKKPRKIKRRGSNKRLHDMQDILNAFLELPPHNLPCYVSLNLSNLPPITMNNFDMSRIVKDIETIKLQMKILQEAQETTLAANVAMNNAAITVSNSSSSDGKPADIMSVTQSQSVPQTSTADNSEASDPDSIDPECESNCSNSEGNVDPSTSVEAQNPTSDTSFKIQKSSYAEVVEKTSQQTKIHKQAVNNSHSGHNQSSVRRGLTTSIHRQTSRRSENANSRSDIITGRGRNFGIHSSSRNMTDIRSKKQLRSVGIFVSRLARHTRPHDIAQHLLKETGLNVRCEPLTTKFDSYRSYCIRLPMKDQDRLLNPMIWPAGTLVRRYTEAV